MNIFALHPSPAVSASMHCDQHLHKMILESAQMLSVAANHWYPSIKHHVYKPAYVNHPCTLWTVSDPDHIGWLISLCDELESIRWSLDYNPHSAMDVIKAVKDCNGLDWNQPKSFQFCGPDQFRLRPDLTIHQKYQAYYKQKYHLWLDTRHPMSYKDRPLPAFLSEFASSIPHNGTIQESTES